MSIGKRIHHLRTQKCFSQSDIERSTGMQRTYISRVERGHVVPSVETLHRFAGALDVPLYRLFYTAHDDPAAAGGKAPATLEELAGAAGHEGTEARFLLQLKPLVSRMAEPDRELLLDCARKLAAR